MSGDLWDTIAPVLGSVVGTAILPGVGTAIGAGIGSGINTGIKTGDPLKGFTSGLLSGAGSYAGGSLVGNAFGGIGSEIGSTAGNVFGGEAGSELGGLAGNVIGNAAGPAIGGYAGSTMAQNVGGKALGMDFNSTGNVEQPAGFKPSLKSPGNVPTSLANLGALSPAQQTSSLATKGVYGGGLGSDESSYFRNLINNRLVEGSNGMGDIAPIESSYLSQLGLGGYSNENDLLKAISQYA